MRFLPDGEQMKSADQYTIRDLGIPSLTLMERAAAGCVEAVKEWGLDLSDVCIVCGSGNNGGDGFAMARMLSEEGYKVQAVLIGNPEHCTQETKYQIERFRETSGRYSEEFKKDKYSLVVDAVFGVGLCREISGRYAEVIGQINQMNAVKVAIDIPSGVASGSGQVLGCAVCADYTVTIQETKIGLLLDPGRSYCGNVRTVDIGISQEPLQKDRTVAFTNEHSDYRKLLPQRKQDSNKGSYGKVLLIAGSKGMSGAAFLNALAAYRTGAGLVRIYTAEENRTILQQQIPEAIMSVYQTFQKDELDALLHWADVVCIGSGLGTEEDARNILKETIEVTGAGRIPCVIDADGLNLLSKNMEWLKKVNSENMILTPHVKEFERISGVPVAEVKKNRVSVLCSFVEEYSLTCVLKDARTLVASKGSRPYVNLSGCSAMAKAGSGDVLAGVITSLAAQGLSTLDAAVLGVYVHGLAGEMMEQKLGAYALLARELADGTGMAMKKIEEFSA